MSRSEKSRLWILDTFSAHANTGFVVFQLLKSTQVVARYMRSQAAGSKIKGEGDDNKCTQSGDGETRGSRLLYFGAGDRLQDQATASSARRCRRCGSDRDDWPAGSIQSLRCGSQSGFLELREFANHGRDSGRTAQVVYLHAPRPQDGACDRERQAEPACNNASRTESRRNCGCGRSRLSRV